MGLRQLISAALHPGTTLEHRADRIMPVDALHALALAPERGSVLIHARLGQDNIPMLQAVVKQVAMEIFAARGWRIVQRKYTAQQRLDMFCEQVWREYMGEPCRRCKGHGWIGRKLDLIRHRLDKCRNCGGSGYRLRPSQSSPDYCFRVPCSTCRGKRLVEVIEELKARRLRQCPECWGSGSIAASVRARAHALRVGHSTLHQVWQERFRVVLMTLRDLERDALIVCREQLYGDTYIDAR